MCPRLPGPSREMCTSLWWRPKELALNRSQWKIANLHNFRKKGQSREVYPYFRTYFPGNVPFDFHPEMSRLFGWMVRFSEILWNHFSYVSKFVDKALLKSNAPVGFLLFCVDWLGNVQRYLTRGLYKVPAVVVYKCLLLYLRLNLETIEKFQANKAMRLVVFHTGKRKLVLTIIGWGFCDIQNNQGRGRGYHPKLKAEADNPYWDLDYSGYHKNRILQLFYSYSSQLVHTLWFVNLAAPTHLHGPLKFTVVFATKLFREFSRNFLNFYNK